LEEPSSDGPVPIVIVVPGSGPIDRNGNEPGVSTDSYCWLARALLEHGFASLRYDKAGIQRSLTAAPEHEQGFRFEMGADDLVLWIQSVKAQGVFRSISLAGHSEGALLSLLAAEQEPVDQVLSLAGAGRPIAELLREQLSARLSDERLKARALEIVAALEQGQFVFDVPDALLGLFRPSIQPYWHSFMPYDPSSEITKIDASILIAQGTTDIQVSVGDAERLARARPDAQLKIIDGMSHFFKQADPSASSQRRVLSEPSLPLMPELVDSMTHFLSR
jgi:uncharacterized protein